MRSRAVYLSFLRFGSYNPASYASPRRSFWWLKRMLFSFLEKTSAAATHQTAGKPALILQDPAPGTIPACPGCAPH